jgi:uncharacterized membrane protein
MGEIAQPARAGAGTGTQGPPRLESVDLLRGLVMVLMALDHTRDFFHIGNLHGVNPLDLQSTTVPLFLTRWITHFCAPVFVFLAGTGAFLSIGRGKSKGELSWFLFSRGLWLIVLELTWVQWLGWKFGINLHEHWFLVIWAIGWSMVVLAVLVQLPMPAILAFGLVMILGHNALDRVQPESWGKADWLWQVLHAGGGFRFSSLPEFRFGAGYPLIPWMGVMAAGFAFGQLYRFEPVRRRRWLWCLGVGLTVGFVLLRLSNWYGNPKPWTTQETFVKTIGSFLDCHKYPPSLCYLLMTLGPALLLLAWLDGRTPRVLKPILVFGRVPLFYYLLHLPLIHGLAILTWLVRYGRADWAYGISPAQTPPDVGFGLAFTYLAWVIVILLLYPACRWFADLKRRRRDAWLSYL